jgi:coenzyme F420-0:L-glutamate ligase/coenzyme F420-1:gamma-L-glutamate ligase
MFQDVLASLRHVKGIEQVVVVASEPNAEFAAEGHVVVLEDPLQEGQSAAALIGIRWAAAAGFERVLLVPGDTPLLAHGEVDALLEGAAADGSAVVIVPDRHDTGTNALLLAPPDAIEPSGGRRRRAAPRRARAVADLRRRHLRRPGGPGRRHRGAAHGGAPHPRRAAPAGSRRSQPRRGRRGRRLTVWLTPLAAIPEVRAGDDLAGLIAAAAAATTDPGLRDGDIVVIAQKVVSKAEGRTRALSTVEPGERARALADEHGKDARLVQVVLDESAQVLRAERGVLICETRHGFVCANAGVDLSNAAEPDTAILLPEDPDASARRIRAALGGRIGVIISDSFGRAWRLGLADVAIGAAGVAVIEDWRGRDDAHGRELRVTEVALADQLAAAADLARTKVSSEPVVVVRGMERATTGDDGPGAAALRRPAALDLFR